ncbi:DUF916 and DUF3324 domain-containing protein [Companilactobacillus sp.]|jgi:hypothetical protein|uniref:DUF916 and DUF3324 domain-containing protein n=1 Tax=Companilactobacillus sp. TaxID=2767905 RepID=UPI0025BF857D|nr:DUF916 and DUF3324 domain-containing protein [Companilactobacillus sp.]MCH4008565.1 DUF916 and DUF3324 domain-containing protein [Companilactobacillus sp.]MCH4051256.1 DUF916 and DUF3324 domain-containing protein [Companilactobacillus sp.]MCH4076508.1 DUF916 and DUF3324 domain-containing protein [Companilactobacillus sp.]MCH4125083.1 DUF916 and DUF3324 domain-containing protein [Companilactobacillus sp.]MCH4131624.1 DUF916 and DUF3324 domain-containing protein [Companilactobacillus sp.]
MRRLWTIVTTILMLILGICAFSPATANAATNTNQSQVKFSVTPQIPDNQINKNVNFYDLKVTPGSTQDIKFDIKNSDSKEHTFLVEVNKATTNANGIVDYSKHGLKKDPSTKYDIESMFPEPQKYTVQANSTETITLPLNAPKKDFKGMILGGIRIVQEDTKAPKNTPGKKFSIKNIYSYVLAVQIQQNTNAVNPTMKQIKAGLSTYNNGPDVAADLENTSPTLINQASINSYVTPQGSTKKVLQLSKKNLQFAPNSNFEFPVNYPNQSLKPGKYTMRVNVSGDNGIKTWNFTKNFTVTRKNAKGLNKVATAKKPNYTLFILAAILIALLIIGLLIWNFKLQRRNRR